MTPASWATRTRRICSREFPATSTSTSGSSRRICRRRLDVTIPSTTSAENRVSRRRWPRCADCSRPARPWRHGRCSIGCLRSRIAARCIAATSGRFISLKRRLLGGYESADIRWQDLKETRISAGIIAADLTLVAQSSSDLNIGSEVNRVWSFRRDCARIRRRPCIGFASSMIRCGARNAACASWRNCARNPAACRSAAAQRRYGAADAAGGGIGTRAPPAPGARNARRQTHQRFRIRIDQGQDRLRPLAARDVGLSAQQIREVAVAQPIRADRSAGAARETAWRARRTPWPRVRAAARASD